MKKFERLTHFFFEVGTMCKLPRMHRQVLLTDDVSDTIASHSYRVALIAWVLANEEKADPYKAALMGLLHDLGESRSGDNNWIYKKYTKVFDEEIMDAQLGSLPFPGLYDLAKEYHARESKEAIIAKDADLLDQVLLLREYEWQGNEEAKIWLYGKGSKKGRQQLKRLRLPISKKICESIYTTPPSAWWESLWTSVNR